MKQRLRSIRLAMAIHAELICREPRRQLVMPIDSWSRTERLVQRIRRAENHKLTLAAERLRVDLQYLLRSILTQVEALERELASVLPNAYRASVSEVFADLVALEDSFDTVNFSRDEHWLSVTTTPITLEGQYLGAFEIRLDWQRLQQEAAFRVIALDAQPAAAQEDVTHPHVRDEILCAGEGHLPIRRALAQGRLLDFFEIVTSVLTNYNGDSAFVGIDDWTGLACSDCSELLNPAYSLNCERCSEPVCHECQSICARCQATFCSACISECVCCRETHCGHCLNRCSVCQELVCSECLDLNERCPHCDQEKENSDACSGPETQETRDPVHADRLGQAPVPA